MNPTIKRTLVVISGIIAASSVIWLIVALPKNTTDEEVDNPVIVTSPTPRIGDALPPDVQTSAPEPETPATQPPPVATAPTPGSATIAQSPQPRVYRNDQLRFTVLMPATWADAHDPALAHEIFFFDQAEQPQGTVEVYDAPGAETIDSLERIVRGDPGASNFERVSYRGRAGIGYLLKGSSGEHFVFLANGKIYYISGEELLTRINFI